jgi:hypothetical protein
LTIKVPEGLNNFNNTSEVHYCPKGQNKTLYKRLDDFKSQRDGLFVITRDVQFELRRSGLKIKKMNDARPEDVAPKELKIYHFFFLLLLRSSGA